MKSITLDSEFNSQNDSSGILNNLESMERIILESNYIKENIAKKLDDNYKIRDSICNYAISLFYNRK